MNLPRKKFPFWQQHWLGLLLLATALLAVPFVAALGGQAWVRIANLDVYKRQGFRRRRLSRRTGATLNSTWIAHTAAFAARQTLIQRMAVWPCSTAISRLTAAS